MKKLIWIGCLSYFVIGLAHVVLGSILPVLLQHYDRSYSAGGELIFSQFAGFLVSVLVSPLLNRRFGKRGGILIATGLLFSAEIAYAFLPPWGWMYVIAVAAGFGFGMIEAVIGTIIIAAVTEGTAVAMVEAGSAVRCRGAAHASGGQSADCRRAVEAGLPDRCRLLPPLAALLGEEQIRPAGQRAE